MSNTISTLSSTFTTLINSLMTIERQPLTALKEKKDTVTIQKAVYTDLNNMLSDFQSSMNSLLSTDVGYSFNAQRKASVSGVTTGSTVVSCSASSSAIPDQYQISVTSLAKEHQVRSDRMAYSDQVLNLGGTFLLGGNGTAAVNSFTGIANTVSVASSMAVADGQRELGTGNYYVETRNDSTNGWQYRLVDAEGNAISIRKQDGNYTSSWQSIPTGVADYDTGRGIKLSFGSDALLFQAKSKGSGAAEIAYQAKGTLITTDADDSLMDIAYAINNASYAQGDEVAATILDNQLVLSRKSTGADRYLIANDQTGSVLSTLGVLSGGTFKNLMKTPANAVFTVNDLQVTRSRNSDLNDVIQGVTLNLASDAEGKDATINVTYDPSGEQKVLNTFFSKFNSLQTYLSAKIATVKQDDGTYKRGALSGDTMFQSLRMDLIQNVNASATNSGIYKSLRDIGISMSDNFSLSITDNSKFQQALSENKKDVTALLDSVMSKLKTKLDRFLGTSGYVTTASKALDSQLENANDQIKVMNERLSTKEESLRTRYAQIQAELTNLSYQEEQFNLVNNTMDYYS